MTLSVTNKMLFSLVCFAFGQLASRDKSLREHLLIQRQAPFTEKTIVKLYSWMYTSLAHNGTLHKDHFLSKDHLLLLHRTCVDLNWKNKCTGLYFITIITNFHKHFCNSVSP